MTSVFIVDDHELMREGLKAVLANHPHLKVLGEAGSFREFTEKIRGQTPDVVVLDISLPDRNGLDILKYLKTLHPQVQVLILSMHPEERFAVRAMKAGAAGYINKQTAAQELVKAIDSIQQTGKYISEEVSAQLFREIGKKPRKFPHEGLTDREFEILRLIAVGKSAGQIAEILSLSINTITTYRARILEKMKMKTTADLVRYVLEKELID